MIKPILLALIATFSFSTLNAQVPKPVNDSIIFAEPVDSLNQLFAKFKGEILFVDFWASWCRMCLEEFKPIPELDEFMRNNHINRLFIAIEKQEKEPALQEKNREKWKGLIEKYQLKGYHYYVVLKTPMAMEIIQKIMMGKLSLPRFAIIDHTGLLVNWDARSPSKTEALMKQLTIYVNRKNP